VLALPRGKARFVGVRARMRDLEVAGGGLSWARAPHDRGDARQLGVAARVGDLAERDVELARAHVELGGSSDLTVRDRRFALGQALA